MIIERAIGCLAVQVGGGLRPPKATLVITPYRAILAQRTKGLEEAHKAQFGGGLFGHRGAPAFADRYLAISPDAALAETPGNSMLVWQQVGLVEVLERAVPNDEGPADHHLVLNFAGPGVSWQLVAYPPYPPAATVRNALRTAFGALVRA